LSLLLECPLIGKADAVVIGDKGMLNLKSFEGIKIMSLKKYLKG
jgi:predicted nucleic acid-binding protein